MASPGIVGGAWLAREHGRTGSGFVAALGAGFAARLVLAPGAKCGLRGFERALELCARAVRRAREDLSGRGVDHAEAALRALGLAIDRHREVGHGSLQS